MNFTPAYAREEFVAVKNTNKRKPATGRPRKVPAENILALVRSGFSQNEVAAQLKISRGAVEYAIHGRRK